MLIELHLENFAILDRLTVRFAEGLNVITGETGAGKSILIDAVSLLLGERASGEWIRASADQARVVAVLDPSASPEVRDLLRNMGLDSDELVVSREINRSGRNINRINERPVTAAAIREVMRPLVHLHGQHEHQTLLKPETQCDLLDAFGGSRAKYLRERVAVAFQTLQTLREQLAQLAGDARERARTLDLYRYQIEEIDAASLRPGEEEALRSARNRLAHVEKIRLAFQEAYATLYESGDGFPSAYDRLGQARSAVAAVLELDSRVPAVLEDLDAAAAHLENAARFLRDAAEDLRDDPEEAARLEARWQQLQALFAKYGESAADVLSYRRSIAEEMERLLQNEDRANELDAACSDARIALGKAAEALSSYRESLASRFSHLLQNELQELALQARVMIEIRQTPSENDQEGVPFRGTTVRCHASGADRVQWLFSANPGEPLRPLQRVASGGELSRFLLGIKSVLGSRDPVPVLIFDEIDAGIGGKTAIAVAEKLARLARGRQVLCVTHLAQIAAVADHHLRIEKYVKGRETVSRIFSLHGEHREQEIARMLAGEQGAVDLAHARALLERGKALRSVG